MKRCWTGIRASDALYTGGYFDSIATLFGAPGSLGYRVDHNKASNDGIVGETINSQVCEIRRLDPDLKIVAYNQSYIDLIKNCRERDYIILDSKTEFRRIMRESGIPALETKKIPNDVEDIYGYIVEREGAGTFVVQCDHSSGGDGTFLLKEDNAEYINGCLRERQGTWFYSVYRERSIPINIHAIISDDEIYLSPGSIQITRVCGCRILYRGADFISYRALDPSVQCTASDHVRKVGELIQSKGYRGVAGIDAIIDGDDVLMVETNLRYQASTFLINKEIRDRAADGEEQWLTEDGQQISMHLLGDATRNGMRLSDFISQAEFERLEVNYSFYTYIAEDDVNADPEPYPGFRKENESIGLQWRHVLHTLTGNVGEGGFADVVTDDWQCQSDDAGHGIERMNQKRYTLIRDGFDEDSPAPEPFSYLYKVTINRRIVTEDFSSITCELGEPEWSIDDFDPDSPLKLKIALINQGIRIPPETLETMGSRAFAVNNSIDLLLEAEGRRLWVNCPCSRYHALLSPFELSADEDGRFSMTYYGQTLQGVTASYMTDPRPGGRVFDKDRGFKENDLCVITTDRLRVQHSSRCKFEKMGAPCTFCEVGLDSSPWVDRAKDPLSHFDLDDILECLEGYMEANRDGSLFSHIMIGGKSCDDPDTTEDSIRRICDTIRRFGDYDIYLMCVPTPDPTRLQRYKDMGVSRVGFNMDVVDDRNSRIYAPGKRSENPSDLYMRSLEAAVAIFGRGKVYSAAVVGLERPENYIGWIGALEDLGVVPVISAFRPVPLTKASITGPPPPSNGLLLRLHEYACDHGKGKGCFEEGGTYQPDIVPGPSCQACQNNTVAIPWAHSRTI